MMISMFIAPRDLLPKIVTPDSEEVRLKRRPGSSQGKGDGKAMQWSLEPWNLGRGNPGRGVGITARTTNHMKRTRVVE